MRTFVEKPKATQQATFAKSAQPYRAHLGQRHGVRSILHLQHTIGNQAVQRMLKTNMEDTKRDSNATINRIEHDFRKRPVIPPDRAASAVSNDKNWGIRSFVRRHRHHFSAVIRQVSPAFQSDSMSADDRESAMGLEAQATQIPIFPPEGSIHVPEDGETVLFPADKLQSSTLPGQSDSIASTFGYRSSITQTRPPSSPGKFGLTTPFYRFASPGPHAVLRRGTFTVTGTIEAQITFWVDSAGRTDIASNSDPDITQSNYPTVAADLTPSPGTLHRDGLTLYQGQPPRTRFWARDLTIDHERFHCGENVRFGRAGLTAAQNWLNRQTARSYPDVGSLLNRVNPIIAAYVDRAMRPPDRELRAYADGAPKYRRRAQDIMRKGRRKRYVPRPKGDFPIPPKDAKIRMV